MASERERDRSEVSYMVLGLSDRVRLVEGWDKLLERVRVSERGRRDRSVVSDLEDKCLSVDVEELDLFSGFVRGLELSAVVFDLSYLERSLVLSDSDRFRRMVAPHDSQLFLRQSLQCGIVKVVGLNTVVEC